MSVIKNNVSTNLISECLKSYPWETPLEQNNIKKVKRELPDLNLDNDNRNISTLRISELGIVFDNNGFEMIIDDFFKKLEKNIKREDYNVLYNEKNNNFDITFDGTNYVLELDSEIMKNYIEGKYNNITLRLKKLSNTELDLKKKKKEIKLEEEKKELAIQRRNEIVENAKKGILPNDEAKSLYLEELKKEKRFSFRNIFSILKKVMKIMKKFVTMLNGLFINTLFLNQMSVIFLWGVLYLLCVLYLYLHL